jgi:hypothetical protein
VAQTIHTDAIQHEPHALRAVPAVETAAPGQHDESLPVDSISGAAGAAATLRGAIARSSPSQRTRMLRSLSRTQGNAFVARLFSARPAVAQRFTPSEHQQIGGATTLGKQDLDIKLDDGSNLTFPEMVALADYFGSVVDIQKLAESDAGKKDVRWTLGFAGLRGKPGDIIATGRQDEIRTQYYKLAASNISHFGKGGTAQNMYQEQHKKALQDAFFSGITSDGKYWNDALAGEAFCEHFLTDLFSAGHVRTPRAEIKQWYVDHYPDSVSAFVLFMAGNLRKRLTNLSLLKHGPIEDAPIEFDDPDGERKFLEEHKDHPTLARATIAAARITLDLVIASKIEELGGAALESFSVGDLVSLAFHDRDNVGLAVVSDVNLAGETVPGGFHWTAFGDKNLNVEGAGPALQMVVAAANASIAELQAARTFGQTMGRTKRFTTEEVQAVEASTPTLNPPFKAERFIPREDPDIQNTKLEWKWGQMNPEMVEALGESVSSGIVPQLRARAPKEPLKIAGIWHAHVDQAYTDFCDYFALIPLTVLTQVMHGPPTD